MMEQYFTSSCVECLATSVQSVHALHISCVSACTLP